MDTEIYKKYTKKDMNSEEYKKLIEEEADIRKKKAEKILILNSIGAGLVGAIPGVDLAVQKLVIQKQATKKIGQIFGLDINLIKKEEKWKNKNIYNDSNFEINENNDNNKNDESNSNNDSNNNKKEIICKIAGFVSSITSNFLSAGKYIGQFTQISTEITTTALRGVSISFFFVGMVIGITTGYYFTYDHCKKLIEQLYNYFKNNIKELSKSVIQAQKYLELRSKMNYNEEYI